MKARNVQAGVLAFVLVILADQITKQIARLYYVEPIHLTGWLKLQYTTNTGAAFSMFSGNNLILMWIAMMVFGLLVYFISELPMESRFYVPYFLVLGGALSNIIDRVFFGNITDFVSVSFFSSFNVADAAISVGAIWLAAMLLILQEN